MKKKKEKIKESEDVGHCGGALGGGGEFAPRLKRSDEGQTERSSVKTS